MKGRRIAAVTPVHAQIGKRNQLLVKITLEDGTFGWGENGFGGRELAVKGMIEHLTPLLIGQDGFAIGHLWQRLYRGHYVEGGPVVGAAISAIDIALHDAKAKKLDLPVYELLGGKQRDRVPGFASTAREPDQTMIDEAKQLISLGWNCLRLSPAQHYTDRVFDARSSIAETAHWLREARDQLGQGPVIGLDYHHRLNLAEAMSFCDMLPAGVLDFLEEPLRDQTPAAYARLRSNTAIPFAIGEEFSSKWQAMPFLEQGLSQFMRIDVCLIGGLTEAMKIAGWCEAHYVDLMPHNPLGPICTAASVHLAAAVPNFSWLECRDTPIEACGFDVPEVFTQQPRLEGAFYPVSDAPGLGITVDETKLKPLGQMGNIPLLERPDGSVANW